MRYRNNKINQLIAERNAAIEDYNRKIQDEIDKEKEKYRFSWKRFLLMVGAVIFIVVAFKVNEKLFSKTSIWSWEYYIGEPRNNKTNNP